MHDSMESVPDDKTAIDLYRKLSTLWEMSGTHTRKWLSNSEELLKEIPAEDRAAKLDLDNGQLPSVKTLRILLYRVEQENEFRVHPPGDVYRCYT